MKHQKRKPYKEYQPFSFRVLVHGKPIMTYRHEQELFFEARPGTEYTLELKNNSLSRVLAVMSVDGLSICDGEAASYDSIGYIVEPYSNLKVPGWSLNDKEVARFKFGKNGDSYASKKGKKRDVGVIGCAVFEEKSSYIDHCGNLFYYVCDDPAIRKFSDDEYICRGITRPYRPNWDSTTMTTSLPRVPKEYNGNGTFTFASSLPGETSYLCNNTPEGSQSEVGTDTVQNVGTEFGRKDDFKVETTEFERKDKPVCVFTLRYDDKKGLEKRGIRVSRKKVVEVANPFPGEKTIGCKPPRGWRGE